MNKFPNSTFNWVGIDGTQVLCHMTPVGTIPRFVLCPNFVADLPIRTSESYNGQATAGEIDKALSNHKVLSAPYPSDIKGCR